MKEKSEMEFLKKRLSMHADFYIVLLAWLIVFFTIVSNFFVYSHADKEDPFFKKLSLEKGLEPGLDLAMFKVINTFLYLGNVAGIMSILFLLDRYYAGKRLRELGVKANIFEKFYKGKIYKLNRNVKILLAIVTFLSLPWLFAQTGNYITDVPLLGKIFLGEQTPNLEGQKFAAVHIGQHHGYEGFVVFMLMLLVFPLAGWIYNTKIRFIAGMSASILIVFSFYSFFEDFINEQIFKRIPIQNFLPATSIFLPYAILIGIFVYAFVWTKLENNYAKKK